MLAGKLGFRFAMGSWRAENSPKNVHKPNTAGDSINYNEFDEKFGTNPTVNAFFYNDKISSVNSTVATNNTGPNNPDYLRPSHRAGAFAKPIGDNPLPSQNFKVPKFKANSNYSKLRSVLTKGRLSLSTTLEIPFADNPRQISQEINDLSPDIPNKPHLGTSLVLPGRGSENRNLSFIKTDKFISREFGLIFKKEWEFITSKLWEYLTGQNTFSSRDKVYNRNTRNVNWLVYKQKKLMALRKKSWQLGGGGNFDHKFSEDVNSFEVDKKSPWSYLVDRILNE